MMGRLAVVWRLAGVRRLAIRWLRIWIGLAIWRLWIRIRLAVGRLAVGRLAVGRLPVRGLAIRRLRIRVWWLADESVAVKDLDLAREDDAVADEPAFNLNAIAHRDPPETPSAPIVVAVAASPADLKIRLAIDPHSPDTPACCRTAGVDMEER